MVKNYMRVYCIGKVTKTNYLLLLTFKTFSYINQKYNLIKLLVLHFIMYKLLFVQFFFLS